MAKSNKRKLAISVEERKKLVGSTIEIWCPADKKFHKALIESYNHGRDQHKVAYVDGDVEMLSLNEEKWNFVNNNNNDPEEEEEEEEDKGQETSSSETPHPLKKKTKGNVDLDSEDNDDDDESSKATATSEAESSEGTQTPPEEMNSYVKITKTITLGVAFKKKNKKTIENVKERLCEVEDIETNLQKAFFTEKNFENDQVLDYERKDGSSVRMNLHLGVGMQIRIDVPWSAKEILLDVHSWDTISDVKTKFQDKEGTPANELTLFYNRKQLDDLQTLASYDIENHSSLDAISLGEDKIVISVRLPPEDPIEVMVKLCSKVINLKRMIHCIKRCGAERQNLTFKGVHLENSQRLADYKIQNGSVIDLDFSTRKCGMKIFVKTLTGVTHTLYVDSSDTVHHLKTVLKYFDSTPVEQQRLIFAGKQLEDSHTLGECGMQKECCLHLVLHLCGC